MRTEQQETFVHRPFAVQLKGYFATYLREQDEVLIDGCNDPIAAATFAKRVNALLRDEADRITGKQFREMLSGDRVPSPAVAQAIADVLAPAVNLYGDVREAFLAAARGAGQGRNGCFDDSDEAARNERILKLSGTIQAQERRLQQSEERKRKREKALKVWRSCNPKGKESGPSFAEMIEEAHGESLRFNQFLERVLDRWDLSPEALCHWMEHLNSNKNGLGKRTLTNSIVYQWMNHPQYLPNAESVLLLRQTFEFGEEQELMLWKVIGGKKLTRLDELIDQAQARGSHGELVKKLVDASGIPDVHIQRLVGIQQLPAWKRGATIESKQAARRFLELIHPVFDPADEITLRQNQRILGLLTARPQTISEAMARAVQHPHPGGALFRELTGRYGLVTLANDELARGLSTAQISVPANKVHKMRRGTRLEKGGRIHEGLAEKILDLVQQELRQEGADIEFTPGERHDCVEIMTGVPSVRTLVARCRKGEIHPGEVLRLTRDRRGIFQEEAAGQIGLSHLSDFELGKAGLQHESARLVARWLGLKGEDARGYVVLAASRQNQHSSEQLLDLALESSEQRCRCLRRIFDATGLTRRELATQAGIDFRRIMSATQSRSRGRLTASKEAMTRLAGVCGLGDRVEDFSRAFAHRKCR